MLVYNDRPIKTSFNKNITKINITYSYPLETFTAENDIGFLDVILPESMILYNNKVFRPGDYVNANMMILSRVLHKKLSNDKDVYKNHINLIKMLREITICLYDYCDYDITNRIIL